MKNFDKIEHLIVCFYLTILLGITFDLKTGVCATLVIGILKEIYDGLYGSRFSWGYLLANIIGILLGVFILK